MTVTAYMNDFKIKTKSKDLIVLLMKLKYTVYIIFPSDGKRL